MGKLICIIPARGGSKRILRKNIKHFLGKPIIAYSIEAALRSRLFDEVMVSTDDKEIAEIAKRYGAKVPFLRSAEVADDFATTYAVINEVSESYKKLNLDFQYTCCLYPTAPFVTSEKLISAFNKLQDKNTNAVLPVLIYSYPIQRSLNINKDFFIKMTDEQNLKTRSQDLTPSYHDVGQFYFYETKEYLETKSIFKMNTKSIIVSELEAQDIDTLTDWKLAELKYKLIHNS